MLKAHNDKSELFLDPKNTKTAKEHEDQLFEYEEEIR